MRFSLLMAISTVVHASALCLSDEFRSAVVRLWSGEVCVETRASRASSPRPLQEPPGARVERTLNIQRVTLAPDPPREQSTAPAFKPEPVSQKPAAPPVAEQQQIDMAKAASPIPPLPALDKDAAERKFMLSESIKRFLGDGALVVQESPPDPVPDEKPMDVRKTTTPAEPAKRIMTEREQTKLQPQAKTSPSFAPPSNPQSASLASAPHIHGVRMEARLKGNHKPVYPPEAHRRLIEGQVVLWIRVSEEGRVVEAKIHESSGYAILDEATLRHAETIELEPARIGTTPIATIVFIPFLYRLIDP